MRKVRILEHITLDGVIQSPGGRDEDEDGDYVYGGWSAPFDDPQAGDVVVEAHSRPFDLLLGRRTYDIWSGYWPTSEGPFAKRINDATKYVATHRPEGLAWKPVEVIGADIVDGIRRIKAKDGPDLIVWGSSQLATVLLEHELAEEIVLLVYPILLGSGKRLFAEGTPPRELTLVSSKAGPSGIVVSTYKPRGPLRTGDVDAE